MSLRRDYFFLPAKPSQSLKQLQTCCTSAPLPSPPMLTPAPLNCTGSDCSVFAESINQVRRLLSIQKASGIVAAAHVYMYCRSVVRKGLFASICLRGANVQYTRGGQRSSSAAERRWLWQADAICLKP